MPVDCGVRAEYRVIGFAFKAELPCNQFKTDRLQRSGKDCFTFASKRVGPPWSAKSDVFVKVLQDI